MKSMLLLLFFSFGIYAGADLAQGDDISPEIQVLAKDAVLQMKGLSPEADQLIVLVTAQISKVRAYQTDELLIAKASGQTQASVAMNFPKLGLIVVNRGRWAKITSLFLRRAIVLHEVLSLMGIESTGTYAASSAYLQIVGLSIHDFTQAMTADSAAQTGDGLSGVGCSWAADRMNFFFDVWKFAVDQCQDQNGTASDTVASFKERRLIETLALAKRNCAGDTNILSDAERITSVIPAYKATQDAKCTQ